MNCSICPFLKMAGIACILELLAEPLYILSQNLFLLKLRMISEVVATLMRCMTAYILIKNSNMVMSLFCLNSLVLVLIVM
jgi:hypothetical protein